MEEQILILSALIIVIPIYCFFDVIMARLQGFTTHEEYLDHQIEQGEF